MNQLQKIASALRRLNDLEAKPEAEWAGNSLRRAGFRDPAFSRCVALSILVHHGGHIALGRRSLAIAVEDTCGNCGSKLPANLRTHGAGRDSLDMLRGLRSVPRASGLRRLFANCQGGFRQLSDGGSLPESQIMKWLSGPGLLELLIARPPGFSWPGLRRGVTVGLIALPLALALGIASIPAGTATPLPPRRSAFSPRSLRALSSQRWAEAGCSRRPDRGLRPDHPYDRVGAR